MTKIDLLPKLIDLLTDPDLLPKTEGRDLMIFYADELQCAEWDAKLAAEHPSLSGNPNMSWCCEPGWYWRNRNNPNLGEGPFETYEEAERDAARLSNQ